MKGDKAIRFYSIAAPPPLSLSQVSGLKNDSKAERLKPLLTYSCTGNTETLPHVTRSDLENVLLI